MNEEVSQEFTQDMSDESIMDSISSLLSKEEEPVEQVQEQVPAPEPETTQPEKYVVKVNGEEIEVSLDELRNGYQRQSDYTKKSQELAEQRNELNTKSSEYNQYLNSIPMLAQVAQMNIQEAANKLYDPEFIRLATDEPATYIAEKAKLEAVIVQNQNAAQQMAQQYEQYNQQLQAQQSQAFEARLQSANDRLSKEIEGWSDGSAIDAIRSYATSVGGFNTNELEGLIDPRQVHILNKARLYDEMMANANAANKKVQSVPSRTITPGVSTGNAERDAFNSNVKNALRSNSEHDIAAMIAQMI